MQLYTVLKLFARDKNSARVCRDFIQMRKDIATFFQTNQHNNQAPSPAKEPSVVPVLTITSQPQCHHQEDKLRARGIQRTFQLTLSTVFLAVNALRTVYIGETGRRLADNFREQRLDILHKKSDLTVAQHLNSPGTRGRSCRRTEIGASQEGCPPTPGDETNFHIPNTRSSRDKSRFSFI